MANMLTFFKYMVLVQVFFSVGVTLLVSVLPNVDTLNYVEVLSNTQSASSLYNVSSDIQSGLEKQTNVPVVDVGALVFYSGNILLDLLLNFAFALPEMFTMAISGVLLLFNIDSFLMGWLQLFITIFIAAMYSFGLIQLITGIRSGRFL